MRHEQAVAWRKTRQTGIVRFVLLQGLLRGVPLCVTAAVAISYMQSGGWPGVEENWRMIVGYGGGLGPAFVVYLRWVLWRQHESQFRAATHNHPVDQPE